MRANIVEVKDVSFTYRSASQNQKEIEALTDINISVKTGEFLVILGRNGSGKSTFAKLLNALLLPDTGVVIINGLRTDDQNNLWDIRSTAGMVFQNPDNQIVGTIVEDDVAFGPENLGIPPEEIRKRVDDSLKTVGMWEYRKHAPHLLSGGQKQKVAVAGILAMKPKCIILDEATSMLDPIGRKELMQVLKKLNKEENITIIHITHHMDEASMADRVIVIDEGRIVVNGSPAQVFSNVEEIKSLGLDIPQITELFYELNKEGYQFPLDILDVDEASKVLSTYIL
ncbi:MAG TPA: energy-coupling factor transporter ATPase [Clostridiaceae bacterium]|nr:energy-coupling factor transporter ATPase [Clostridiaceae bacterium]